MNLYTHEVFLIINKRGKALPETFSDREEARDRLRELYNGMPKPSDLPGTIRTLQEFLDQHGLSQEL